MKANKTSIIYIANAGFMVTDGKIKILIDAVHTEQALNFSPIPERIMNKIIRDEEEFSGVDYMIFTHVHKDHCNLKKLCEVQNPKTKIILPELDEKSNQTFKDEITELSNPILYLKAGYGETIEIADKNLLIKAVRTYHDGENFSDSVMHYSYLICLNGQQILFMGDAESGNPKIVQALKNEKIDAVCANFTEISQEKGRDIINTILKPQLVVACHLPLQEHDKYHYRERTIKQLSKYQNALPTVHLCLDTMEVIDL